MTLSHPETFRSIGQILGRELLPEIERAGRFPLRLSCLGVASSGASDRFDRMIPLGECASPEEGMRSAALRLSRGDICTGPDSFPDFRPRIMLIQDRTHSLVLGGEIRVGLILWQQPVASDAEGRHVVREASQLRGMAFRTQEPGDAGHLRHRASVLETRLVDPFWRDAAADLLRLPQAA